MTREPIARRVGQLASWAQEGRLAVLTGAGVSMLPPSSLPSWWEVSIGAYRAVAASQPGLQDFEAIVEKLNLPPTVLAQYLWDVAGDEYFSSLAILRQGRPNANHQLIAALGTAGLVTSVFTLNFDTLHEQALQERGTPFETVVGDRGGDRSAGGVTVYKLHGTIDDLSTIKATLDQTTTTKGIGPTGKQRLAAIRAQCHLLVLGYSGGDFFLDLDYLGLVSHSAPTTIVWNMLPGEAVRADHPLNQLAAACPEIEICEGALPDLLFQLAEACRLDKHNIESPSGGSSRLDSLTWTPPPGLWPGHLFAKVFEHVGQNDRELECVRWEADAAVNDPSPHRTAWAIGAMAQWYTGHGHREIARAFLNSELEMVRLVGQRAQCRVPPRPAFSSRVLTGCGSQ